MTKYTLSNLIKALNIFLKYEDRDYLIGSEHQVFYVFVDPNKVVAEDLKTLEALGFQHDLNVRHFWSYDYGIGWPAEKVADALKEQAKQEAKFTKTKKKKTKKANKINNDEMSNNE